MNLILSTFVGATGFIIANCINAIIRIFYNMQHIRSVIRSNQNSDLSIRSFLPTLNLFILLTFAFFLTSFSYMVNFLKFLFLIKNLIRKHFFLNFILVLLVLKL